MDVEGRALETITVRYRNSSTPEVARNKSTSWNIRGMRFATPAPIKRWTYVKILDPRTGPTAVDVREAAKVATEFQKRLIHHGVMLPGKPESNRDGHLEVFDGRVDGPFGKRLKQFDRLGADLPLLLIVLPDDNKHRYERLKDLCDRAYGVRNVCAIAEKIGGCNNLQYLSNLCLKVNLKMSGINHIVPAKPLGFIEDNKTMRVGIDVTHPPETAPEGAPSVVAMVASTDGRIAQWPAELRIQEGRSRKGGGIEITTENLRTMLSVHLRRWTARHQGRLPTKILVYRDGIGESQYVVSQKELPQLQLACEDVLKDKSTDERPRITFIVCAKRHQIRFYAPQDPKGDFVKNPPASTYVDTGVTESRPWDFYLLAHESVKGTARAAHYIVLHDDVIRREAQPPGSSPANLLAKVTHNMCYLFGRCTTSVSIVPAVDYAHLACSRARFYMQDVYAGTGGPSPATLSDDTALMVWQWGLNALYWKPHDKVKDTMFYV